MAEVQVENVAAGYGKNNKVIDQVSFDVEAGEMIGIVGPNGSGKSTLLRVLAGLQEASAGSVRYDNVLLSSFTPAQRARTVAYLPQFDELTAAYTVHQVVEMGRYAHRRSLWPTANRKKEEETIQSVMQQMHVWPKRFHLFQALSGGEKQRVLLARLLAQEPECLLLDEPTNHLDIHYRIELLNYIRAWASEEKRSVVVVMHDIHAAALYCDQVLMLSEGRVEAFNEPTTVFTEQRLAKVYQADIQVTLQHEVKAPAVHWRPPQTSINEPTAPLTWTKNDYRWEAASNASLNVYASSLKKHIYGHRFTVNKKNGTLHIFEESNKKRPAQTIAFSARMHLWKQNAGSREAVFGVTGGGAAGQACFLWLHTAEGWPAQEVSALQLYIQKKAFEWLHGRGRGAFSPAALQEIIVTAPVKKYKIISEKQLHGHYLQIGKLIESLLDDYNSASG